MALLRTHHNVYDTHYHIVFPVKYRKALLQDDIPLAIVDIAQEISLRYDIDFEKIGTDLNHIHILGADRDRKKPFNNAHIMEAV